MQHWGHIATASVTSRAHSTPVIPRENAFVMPSEDFSPSRGTLCFRLCFPLRSSASSAVHRLPLRSFAPFAVTRFFRNLKSAIRNLIVFCLVLAFSIPLFAQAAPSEYDVKAAYLYNFGKFVKWPQSSTKGPNFLICVLGADPFNGTLESTVAGEKVNDKPAKVVHLDSTREASSCNILYVSRSERYRVRQVLTSFDVSGTLTVSDISNFTDNGGMIQFVNQSGRIRFVINLAAAQQAGLNLSSELLKVASSVKGNP